MIKKINSLFLLSFLSLSISAQKMMHSVGTSANLNHQKITIPSRYLTPEKKVNQTLFYTSGDYFFRYNVKESDLNSISIGVPVALGFGSANDPNNDEAGLFLGANISMGVFYNNGLKSTRNNETNFGYFVGGGISYGYVGLYYDKKTNNITTYGPMIYSGIRFPVLKQVMSVGLFFRYGLETEKLKTYGLKLMRDF
jgi:hypothetical protein